MEKYINLFTDFGFKKVFGEEPKTELVAFKPQERAAYQASLKYYRDLKNVTDTAFDEGMQAGRAQERLALARQLKQMGMADEQIVQATGLSLGDIGGLG